MALTGGVVNGYCYPTQSDALDAYYTGQSLFQTAGSTSYVNEFVKDTATNVWKINGYSVSTAGVWTTRFTTNAPVPVFPACDPVQSFSDGIIIGWGIASAIVFASAVVLMKRGARFG